MKYYKDNTGNVFAYELDGSQDEHIGDKTLMTASEIDIHINPPSTPEQRQTELEGAVQYLLDTKAKEKGYESILSACSYAGYANPFQTEGQSFVKWRGDVWAKCYQVLADVNAGTRAEPTIDQLIVELPTYVLIV